MSHATSNTAQIRLWNKHRIKEALRQLSCGTKNSVSRMTDLSVATCNTLLNELALTGEILELEQNPVGESFVGRPAKYYCYNENYAYVCSLCLYYENGERRLSHSIRNLANTVIAEGSVIRERIDLKVLIQQVTELIERYPNIAGIGIGIPGIVNRDGSVDVCDLEELSGVPLKEELAQQFGIPVCIENDMNLIAYGLYQKGKETEGILTAISFFRENLPGTGIIMEGQILHGKSNFAGEVSYLPLGYDRAHQLALYKDPKAALQLIGNTLACVIGVLNPDTIALTGEVLQSVSISEINAVITQSIPEKHLPNIHYIEDADPFYHLGNAANILHQIDTYNTTR